MPDKLDDDLLTLKEVAAYLKVTIETIYYRIKKAKNKIKTTLNAEGKLRISKKENFELLKNYK